MNNDTLNKKKFTEKQMIRYLYKEVQRLNSYIEHLEEENAKLRNEAQVYQNKYYEDTGAIGAPHGW